MSNERNIQDTPCYGNHCDVNTFQEIDVCVPITVEPYVDLGDPIIECIEEPNLVPIPCGAWDKRGKCRFAISQKLSIMIPIEFKAEACSGPASISCLGQEEEEEECPPYICCGKGERMPFVICEEEGSDVSEKRSTVCCEREGCTDICCERECSKFSDFYYFVKGIRGRLKE